MPYTLAQLQAIDDAIAQGATSVSYEGKSVSYRSLDEMLRIRNLMARDLGLLESRSRTFLVAHSRGGSAGFGAESVDDEE